MNALTRIALPGQDETRRALRLFWMCLRADESQAYQGQPFSPFRADIIRRDLFTSRRRQVRQMQDAARAAFRAGDPEQTISFLDADIITLRADAWDALIDGDIEGFSLSRRDAKAQQRRRDELMREHQDLLFGRELERIRFGRSRAEALS
jgi:hypothetical protein